MRLPVTFTLDAGRLAGFVDLPDPLVPGVKTLQRRDYALVADYNFGTNGNVRNMDDLQAAFLLAYPNGADKLNDEWQRYRQNNNHVLTADALQLVARNVSGIKDGGIESGVISSRLSQRGGYFEMRARVPGLNHKGAWPAFWFVAADKLWPPENDIVEIPVNSIVANQADNSWNSFHNVAGAATVNASKLDQWGSHHPGIDLSAAFHTYACEWLPGDRMITYLDDVAVVDRVYPWQHADGSDAGPATLLVDLAYGGQWAGRNGIDPAGLPCAFEIDYLRVWR